MNDDQKILTALGAAMTVGSGLGSIPVLTITKTIFGGLITVSTTTVTVPAMGIIGVAGLATYGVYKIYQAIKD